jgi:hypothetical protein
MNRSIFRRLVWKEYRLQRAFWIAMVVLAVLLHGMVIAFARQSDVAQRTMWIFEVSLAMAALYALGCGATLFATEHEADTYEFQRSLPVSAGRFFLGKATFAALSTLAMIGLLWGLAAMMAGWRLPEPRTHLELWGLWGFGAVELLVWGTFFSLVLRRPLAAAVLAIVCASLSIQFLVAAFGPRYFREPYLDALARRAALAAALAVVTIWVGQRWFRERLFGVRKSEESFATGEVPEAPLIGLPRRTGLLVRLVWQHARQSAVMLAILSAMVAPLCVAGFWLSIHALSAAGNLPGIVLPAAVAVIAAPLAGACVFLGDQRRRGFRFLAHRGVSARHVWLSRHLVWLVPVLLWTALILPVAVLPVAIHSNSAAGVVYLIGAAFAFVILAYAAGQLASMFFSSGILAGFFSVALTLLLCVWAGLTWFLGVPWLWSVVPIPLVLLLATWLRAPYWLLERNTLRAWLPTALCLAVPTAAIVTGACAHRVYSIPRVDPGFDPQAFAQPAAPEARATVDMYRRALDLYDSVPDRGRDEKGTWRSSSGLQTPLTEADLALLDENQPVLDLMREATQRPCDFFDPTGRIAQTRPGDSFYELGCLLINSARRLESKGKLDAALERYLAAIRFSAHLRNRSPSPLMVEADRVERYAYDCLASWAAHPGQTAERLGEAIDQLGELQKGMPSPADAIKLEYLVRKQIVDGDLDVTEVPDAYPRVPPDRASFSLLVVQWLPWERARTHRVLRLSASSELQVVDSVEAAVRRNQPVTIPDPSVADFRWELVRHNTLPLYALYEPQAEWLAWRYLRMETRRRAVLLQLALAGWEIEHGELPKRLEDLAGTFFEQVPLDPFTGRPFQYFPEGQPERILDEDPWRHFGEPRPPGPSAEVIVRAGRPYLQSDGLSRRRQHPDAYRSYYYAPKSDRDFVFEIPVPR